LLFFICLEPKGSHISVVKWEVPYQSLLGVDIEPETSQGDSESGFTLRFDTSAKSIFKKTDIKPAVAFLAANKRERVWLTDELARLFTAATGQTLPITRK
jgi:hypothetical protein